MDMQTVSELTLLFEMLNKEPVSMEEEPKPIKRMFTRGIVLMIILTFVLISVV